MRETFKKYGVRLSDRELILTEAAYAAGLSDAYNRYKEAIDEKDPHLVQLLLDDVIDKIGSAKESLHRIGN